ncbi:MAG: hypothetical protein CSA66_01585 [Proteobacteria bacterium]|nr:MAG: hypothetical protein CSA66_01585 [Pseudomonadota bacterium]
MGHITDALMRFFAEDGWTTEPVADPPGFRAGYQGDHGHFILFAQVREEHEQLVFYSLTPDDVPEGRRAAVGELFNRLNYGLVVGNFEIDYDDGEIRYRSAGDFEGVEPTTRAIKNLVHANILSFDRWAPVIEEVIAGTRTPKEAIAAAEAGDE